METNDPSMARFRISLKAELIAVFTTTPWRSFLISLPVGQKVTQTMVLTRGPGFTKPVEITGLDNNLGELVKAELETVKPGEQYKLSLTVDGQRSFVKAGYLTLHLTGGPGPVFNILAQINVWAPRSKVSGRPTPAVRPTRKPAAAKQ